MRLMGQSFTKNRYANPNRSFDVTKRPESMPLRGSMNQRNYEIGENG